MTNRLEVLSRLAATISSVRLSHPVRVAIDGVDAAGKTTLAYELTPLVRTAGRPVVRASIDGFHHPRVVRYQRGSESPDGYYRDSFDYAALKSVLLVPLGPDDSLRYLPAMFDWRSDTEVVVPVQVAHPESVLLFDGVFLHRPELDACWDLTVWVEASFDSIVERAEHRAQQERRGLDGLRDRYRHRYIPGQVLYLHECRPRERADLVVDNNDVAHPRLIDQRVEV